MGADAAFTYTPVAAWRGTDSFAYACTNGSVTSNSATVTVQTWQPTQLGLTVGDLSPRYDGSTSLKAVLKTRAGAPLSGRAVTFEYLSGTKWLSLGSVVTGTSGGASKAVSSLKSARRFRARTNWSSVYGAAGSQQVRVAPHVSLPRPVAPSSVRKYRSFSLYGYLKPRHTSGTRPVRLYFYRLQSTGWVRKTVVSAVVRNYSSYSKYTKSMSLSSRGRWRVLAYHAADSSHSATWSSAEYFTVK